MIRSTQYGRPYIRCTPTRWMTDTVFAERVNDTRYSKTFQTVWYANDPVTPSTYPKWRIHCRRAHLPEQLLVNLNLDLEIRLSICPD